jgi:hypothetical protein
MKFGIMNYVKIKEMGFSKNSLEIIFLECSI